MIEALNVRASSVIAAFTLLGAAATALGQTSRDELGSAVQIVYGTVESIEVSKLDPTASAAHGAVVGGALGLAAASHEHNARGAAEGAAAGALISGLIAKHQKENAPNAYAYTVALVQGGESKIITDRDDLREGDCVSVEYGRTANIRRVGNVYCHSDHQAALDDPRVHANAQASAEECHAAKQIALQAKTEQDMDMALKKVRIFCDS